MKIELLEGCNYSMEIDNIEFVNLSKDKQKEIAHKLIDIADECTLQDFIEDICHTEGEFKDLGRCETCGEYNEKYTLNI